MIRLLFVIALVACSSKGPKDPTFTPAGPKLCERMADHLVVMMMGGKKDEDLKATTDKISRVLIDRCTKDGWTEDAQKCFLAATTMAGRDKLTVVLPESLSTLGLWIEQLIADYAGASGRDIKELLKLTSKYCRRKGLELSAAAFAQCAVFRGVACA